MTTLPAGFMMKGGQSPWGARRIQKWCTSLVLAIMTIGFVCMPLRADDEVNKILDGLSAPKEQGNASATPVSLQQSLAPSSALATESESAERGEDSEVDRSNASAIVKEYIQSLAHNQTTVYERTLADVVDYQYIGRRTPKSLVVEDRQKLIHAYPTRNYQITGAELKMTDGRSAQANISYSYRYAGIQKNASGRCRVVLNLERVSLNSSNPWRIVKIVEGVQRDR